MDAGMPEPTSGSATPDARYRGPAPAGQVTSVAECPQLPGRVFCINQAAVSAASHKLQ